MESTEFLARQPAYRIAVSWLPSQKYWLRALKLGVAMPYQHYLSRPATIRLQGALLTWVPSDMLFAHHLAHQSENADDVFSEIISRLSDARRVDNVRLLILIDLMSELDSYPGYHNWVELLDRAIGRSVPSLLFPFSPGDQLT